MRLLRFLQSGPSDKMSFGFRASFGLKWAKRALFQEKKEKERTGIGCYRGRIKHQQLEFVSLLRFGINMFDFLLKLLFKAS